jgi:hypothetical protein
MLARVSGEFGRDGLSVGKYPPSASVALRGLGLQVFNREPEGDRDEADVFRFARDSPPEGDGLELPVPGREAVKPSCETLSKTGADLLGNRRFESISLQPRVCDPSVPLENFASTGMSRGRRITWANSRTPRGENVLHPIGPRPGPGRRRQRPAPHRPSTPGATDATHTLRLSDGLDAALLGGTP